jgi:dihydroflavonol-4-reductase
MTPWNSLPQIHSAFVTGATGLLGNNLVRLLVSRGVHVKALSRSRTKAERQFGDLSIEIVTGDITNVGEFAAHLQGNDMVFHTAAFFRDGYKGGRHWKELYDANVRGTAELFAQAYSAGVRRIVHTSSVAVLAGKRGQRIDESMRRRTQDADDYYLSKILSDREIDGFLETHPEMWACMVLPGWMVGPGDAGPTSSGQVILDFLSRRLPGVPPATFSVVDARDVAEAMWLAAIHGQRSERYIVAGRHMKMGELFQELERLSGVRAPRWGVSTQLLYAIGAANEVWARIGGRPALISLATVRLMVRERDRTRFDHRKSEQALGIRFRPVEETLRDTIAWYRENGWSKNEPSKAASLRPAGEPT